MPSDTPLLRITKRSRKSRLFQAIVVLGGALTGSAGVVVGVVATVPMSACGADNSFAHVDMAQYDFSKPDMSVWVHVDLAPQPDLAQVDAESQD